MLTVLTNITIKQTLSYQDSTGKDIPRTLTLNFDFCHSYETSDSWSDLTNKGKIILPKNVYIRNSATGKLESIGTYFGGPPSNINIGAAIDSVPLLLRGDRVTISAGYRYLGQDGNYYDKQPVIYQGFISRVTSKKPLEFEVEDNMWLLKQIAVPVHTFTSSDTLESILNFMLSSPAGIKMMDAFGVTLTVNSLTETTFGAFRIGNENIADFLSRLRKQFHFESYFRGDELRCGSLVYLQSDIAGKNPPVFEFQNNIISDQLEYSRKDDLKVSAIARNTIDENIPGGTTKDGSAKTKKTRLEVLVTINPGGTITSQPKVKGKDYPLNLDGVRSECTFLGATTTDQLAILGAVHLKKYYYTGLKGKFTTFGLPFVRQGDNIQLTDKILPERNGLYKVKRVDHTGGINGLRQVITLDYRVGGASLTLTPLELQTCKAVGIDPSNI